jgi:hypothetical protein
MTTQISGDTGVSQCQPNSVSQDDLQSGVVGKGPTFSAKLSADVVIQDSVPTVIVFPVEVFDTSNSYDPLTGKFTPQVAGYYQLNASVGVNANAGKSRSTLQLVKNATDSISVSDELSGGRFVHSVSGLAYLNGTTDYVNAYAFGVGTVPFINGLASPAIFSAALVRAA